MNIKKSKIAILLNNFSANLKRIRTDKGLTQKKLAELSGLTIRAIGHYETDVKNPPADCLIALASALNLSVDELLDLKKVDLRNNDISSSTLKKARIIDKLPTRSRNAVYKFVNELADKAGIE